MARKRQREDAPAGATPPASVPVQVRGRERVVFTRTHTHRGEEFAPGDGYWATPEERELLAHFGVIEVP